MPFFLQQVIDLIPQIRSQLPLSFLRPRSATREDDWVRRNVSSENDVPQEANDPERCTGDVTVQEPEPVTEDGNRCYPSREHRKPKRYSDYVLDESAKYTVDYCFRVADVPKTYTDAMHSVESDKWQSAMEEEIDALTENDTFEFGSRLQVG